MSLPPAQRPRRAPHCVRVLAGLVLCDLLFACLLHAARRRPEAHWARLEDM